MHKAAILEAFHASIAKYVQAFPEYENDIKNLQNVYDAVNDDKLVDAARMTSRLDTFVRDYVPTEVDRFISLELDGQW